jgi:hypothetical protein
MHEGRGAVQIGWECEEVSGMEVARNDQEALRVDLEGAWRESVLVNAAVYGEGKGWYVDMEVESGLDSVMSGLYM